MIKIGLRNFLGFIGVFVLLSACSLSKKEKVVKADNTMLFNNEWRLVKMGSKNMKYEEGCEPITLLLTSEPENVSGFSGCNRYFGKFATKKNKLSFKQMACTLMACPQQDMNLEDRYLQLLDKVNSFTLQNDTLMLLKDDKVLLIFEK